MAYNESFRALTMPVMPFTGAKIAVLIYSRNIRTRVFFYPYFSAAQADVKNR